MAKKKPLSTRTGSRVSTRQAEKKRKADEAASTAPEKKTKTTTVVAASTSKPPSLPRKLTAADQFEPDTKIRAALHERATKGRDKSIRLEREERERRKREERKTRKKADKARRQREEAIKREKAAKAEKIGTHCIVCDEPNLPMSVFCGASCTLTHSLNALAILQRDGSLSDDAPITVVERHTGNVLEDSFAPRKSELKLWLNSHPTFRVVLPESTSTEPAAKANAAESIPSVAVGLSQEAKTVGALQDVSGQASKAESSDNLNEDPVRRNVRDVLLSSLLKRWQEAPADAAIRQETDIDEESIRRLSHHIEGCLYRAFREPDVPVKDSKDSKRRAPSAAILAERITKYKNKYRSVVMNIRASKNLTFFQAILRGDIKPSDIPTLAPFQMASNELKRWRAQEQKAVSVLSDAIVHSHGSVDDRTLHWHRNCTFSPRRARRNR